MPDCFGIMAQHVWKWHCKFVKKNTFYSSEETTTWEQPKLRHQKSLEIVVLLVADLQTLVPGEINLMRMLCFGRVFCEFNCTCCDMYRDTVENFHSEKLNEWIFNPIVQYWHVGGGILAEQSLDNVVWFRGGEPKKFGNKLLFIFGEKPCSQVMFSVTSSCRRH